MYLVNKQFIYSLYSESNKIFFFKVLNFSLVLALFQVDWSTSMRKLSVIIFYSKMFESPREIQNQDKDISRTRKV